jgi:hypothetical protein
MPETSGIQKPEPPVDSLSTCALHSIQSTHWTHSNNSARSQEASFHIGLVTKTKMRGSGRIRLVLFDAFDTLVFPNPPVARAYTATFQAHNLAVTEPAVSAAFRPGGG